MNIRFNFKGYTIKDLNSINEEDKLKFDKRTFCEYFKDALLGYHQILSLCTTKSLMEPISLRISHLYFSIALNMYFNAVFYSDDYIEKRATSYLEKDIVEDVIL